MCLACLRYLDQFLAPKVECMEGRHTHVHLYIWITVKLTWKSSKHFSVTPLSEHQGDPHWQSMMAVITDHCKHSSQSFRLCFLEGRLCGQSLSLTPVIPWSSSIFVDTIVGTLLLQTVLISLLVWLSVMQWDTWLLLSADSSPALGSEWSEASSEPFPACA